MAPKRYRRAPQVTCLPRSSLDFQAYPAVDAALKDLKGHARKLQSLVVAQGEEMQLLERLYYKGKNQHRSALFWSRLEEVRKYGKRLQELEPFNLMELLRCSFFGAAVVENPKSMKGPWTHYPDGRCILFVMERLSSCSLLLEKTRIQLSEAYQFFCLSMQSGYFVQLVLTIVAITSRLDSLASELRPVLSDWHQTCAALLSSLHPGRTLNITKPIALVSKRSDANNAQIPALQDASSLSVIEPSDIVADEDIGIPISNPSVQAEAAEDEDLGVSVSLPYRQTSQFVFPDTRVDDSYALERRETEDKTHDTQPPADSSGSSTFGSLSTSAHSMQVRKAEKISELSSSQQASSVKRKVKANFATATGKPKRRKKKDEIDEIFGF